MMKGLSFLFFALCYFGCLFSQVTEGIVPPGIYPYSYQNPGCNEQQHFLLTPFKLNASSGPVSRPQIVDGNGDLVWYLRKKYPNTLNFNYFPQFDKYSFTARGSQGQITYVLDSQMNVIDSVLPLGASSDAHEFLFATNGNYIVATKYLDTVDLSGQYIDTIPGSSQTVLVGFGWQEITPSGTIVSEWNSNDHLDPTESFSYYGYNANQFDYCHGNAIAEDVDGNFILSFRHMNALYKINRQTGGIIWKLGGNNSDFTFLNDEGISGQHHVSVLGQDTISVFNNGNMSSGQFSRGVVYLIDSSAGTVKKIHEVIHSNPFLTTAMGSYQYSDVLETVGYGMIYSPHPGLTVVGNDQSLKFELYAADSVISYRALHKAAASWNRPQITCTQVSGQWVLEAPVGYASYMWNTGATTASIPLTQAGTFQVWVNFGDGMLGSEKLVVDDIFDPCETAGLDELAIPTQEATYYDLLGRKAVNLESGNVYIRVYEGSGQKSQLIVAP